MAELGIPALPVEEVSGAGSTAIDLTSLEEICHQAAVGAAQIVRHTRQELADEHGRVAAKAYKSSAVDPVTAVDEASEKFLQHFLLRALPGSEILGEEQGQVVNQQSLAQAEDWDSQHEGVLAGRSMATHWQNRRQVGECVAANRVVWVVDPIDGTVNFLYGQPDYAVSVAACVEGVPIAAAVIHVATGQVYLARVGGSARLFDVNATGSEVKGAERSGRILRGPKESELASALVATGFGYVASQREMQARVLVQLLPRVRDIRRGGSAALDLCHLATGTVDAYYEHGLGAWDYAAGVLIAARSGVNTFFPRLQREKTENLLVIAAKSETLAGLSRVLKGTGAGVSLASN